MGTATQALNQLAVIAGPEASRRRGWPATPRGLVGILRRLSPSLRDAQIGVVFGSSDRGGTRTLRIHFADDPNAAGGQVLAFATPLEALPPAVRETADALRAAGVDESWSVSRAAALALLKAGGDAAVAAGALNVLAISSPGGGNWTPDLLRGVV